MNKNVFDFSHYKDYIRARTGTKGLKTGVKSALAKALNVQPTYVSQVLHGSAEFNLEQAEKLNSFLGHTKEESDFLYLLILRDRAGSRGLKAHFSEQIQEILRKRMVLTERLGERKSLADEQQSIYYSSWIYAAVHMAVTIPALQKRADLAEHLRVPVWRVSEVLEFLMSAGLVAQEGEKFRTSALQLRLGNQSHNIVKHHTNWRSQAIESLEREQETDLHYSAVVSLSATDVTRLKNQLLESIREAQKVVQASREEELIVFNVDLFSLRR